MRSSAHSGNSLSSIHKVFQETGDVPPAPPTPQTASRQLTRHVSIEGTQLLRGVPLSRVMTMLGAMLQTSEGQAKDYLQSHATVRLDAFLSHNWSMNRYEKFIALAVHYNGGRAVIAAVLTGIGCAALTLLGYLPIARLDPLLPMSFNSWFVGHIAFFAVLFFGQHFHCFCCQERTMFLDKTCISQTDAQLQRQGIINLAGFLQASDKIVVLYGPAYLEKLWTVYELVSYMLIHQDLSRIQLISVYWCNLTFRLNVMLFITSSVGFSAYVGVRLAGLPNELYLPIYVACVVFYAVGFSKALQLWRREHWDIKQRIAKFRIQDASCAVEEDRALVQDNVYNFLVALGWVDVGEDKGQALERFNQAVRHTLPFCLSCTSGQVGLSYRSMLTSFVNFILIAIDHVAADVHEGVSIVSTVGKVLSCSVIVFTMLPVGMVVSNRLVGTEPHKASWFRNFLSILPCLLAWWVSFVTSSITVAWEGVVSVAALAILVAETVLLSAVTIWLYGCKARRRRNRGCSLDKYAVGPQQNPSNTTGDDTISQESLTQESLEIVMEHIRSGLPQSNWRRQLGNINRGDCENIVDRLFEV